ncbi:MAG: winged helix-turn-helix domain-containing protein [bacterium]|nr:winged helix-turn-helix domain-containing protein [bacterium]
MTYLEAAHLILAEARKPLTEAELVSRAIRKGLISPRTDQPERSMAVVLNRASQNPSSSFERTAPHTWQLKASKILEHPMSMREAAHKILALAGRPLHYQEITRRAIRAGLIRPEGKTPAYTLRARVGDDMQRNPDSLFIRVADGTYALKVWPKELSKARKAASKGRKASASRTVKAAPRVKPEATVTTEKAPARRPGRPRKVENPAPVVEKREPEPKAPVVRARRGRRPAAQAEVAPAPAPIVVLKPRVKIADADSLARLQRNKAARS